MEVPNNVEFERKILGFALRDPEAREEVTSRLRVEDFYDNDNATVFQILSQKARSGLFIDVELLVHELGLLTGVDRVSNNPLDLAMALVQAGASMTSAATTEYILQLRQYGKARDVVALGQRLMVRGGNVGSDPDAIDAALQDADQDVQSIIDRNVDASWESLASIVSNFETNEDLQPLFPSGLADLDNLLQGGFRPGQFVTIAARPAMGKSTFAMEIAQSASVRKGVPGLVISLEMSRAEIGMRVLAAQGSVPLESLQKNLLSDQDHDNLDSIEERFAASQPPLYVVDSIEPSFPAIRAEIIAAHRRVGIKFVVLDYLQLIDSDGTGNPSREQVVSNISRQVKALARSLGIVIFVVSQLNRKAEERTNHRPMTSDLRESGQIEQDSDLIILLYRPEVYTPEDRPGECDLIVGKHRNGRTGDVPVLFMGHFSRFRSMAREEAYAPSA